MKRSILFPTCFLLLLTGCRLGPSYQPPEVCVPEEWKAEGCLNECPGPCVDYWWEVFDDPVLDDLERQAIDNNPQVDIALQRVAEARVLAQVAGAALWPQLSLNPAYSSTGELFKLFIPPGIVPTAASNGPGSVFRIHQMQYFLPLTLNYEVDLWGRIRSQRDAAEDTAEASVWDYHAVLLTLTTDLASTYFQLRALDAQIRDFTALTELSRKALMLAESRYQKGLTDQQASIQAQLQLSNDEANELEAQRQRSLLEDILATQVGVAASEFCLEPNPLVCAPPCIPPGTPADILLQRPDLARAERQRASEQALIGAAYAAFFPTLNLSGTIGYESPDLKDFLTWKSRYWQLAGNSSEELFNGGRDMGNVAAAWARFGQASGNYQQLVLTAFQEVEDSLNNVEFQAQRYTSYDEASKAAQHYAQLSQRRNLQGLVGSLDVLTNDRGAWQAAVNVDNTLGLRYVATVQLIKALGGSWACDE